MSGYIISSQVSCQLETDLVTEWYSIDQALQGGGIGAFAVGSATSFVKPKRCPDSRGHRRSAGLELSYKWNLQCRSI